MAANRSSGAGTRTATIRSRLTPAARRRTRTTSAITTARNISAISPTIRPKRPTCAAKATSSPTWRKNALPRNGGVFYLRGGYYNLNYPKQTAIIQNPNYPNKSGLTPAEIAAIDVAKSGDDDHPSYSDSQLTEAMAARAINAIAANKDIWEHSAIIITYDESDGLYDHVPPRILSYGPDGLPIARGIRIPLLLISPYARVHAVSHAEGDHNAVIETINALFGLPALSSLPDEAEALAAGDSPAFNAFAPAGFEQKYLGPARRQFAHRREPAIGLRQGAGERRAAAAAGALTR